MCLREGSLMSEVDEKLREILELVCLHITTQDDMTVGQGVSAIKALVRESLPEKKDVSGENVNDCLYRLPPQDGDTITTVYTNYEQRHGWNNAIDTMRGVWE